MKEMIKRLNEKHEFRLNLMISCFGTLFLIAWWVIGC